MQGFKRHIILAMLSATMLTLATACSLIYDEPADNTADEPESVAGMVSLTLSVPKAAAGDGPTAAEGKLWGDLYNKATGTSYDLSVNTDMLHFAVFDTEGNYRGEISKILCFRTDGTAGSDRYTYSGKLPEGLDDATTYRVMAFANAPGYTDAATYTNAESNFDLSRLQPDNGIVPMWGVVSSRFQTGKRTELTEVLQLLRAVSKTYVTLDEATTKAGFRLTSAKLTLPVAQGKITPENWNGVNKTTDVYFRHDSKVYSDALNPVASGSANTQNFYEQSTNLFVVYTPEYDNDKGDAVINFTLTDKDGKDYAIEGKPFEIRYRDYSQPEGAYFDIARNHIYTFEVGIDTQSGLIITVRKWFAAYDNNFIFDTPSVDGGSVDIEDWGDDGGGILTPV